MFTGLLFIDAPVALSAAALFGGAYAVIAAVTSQELRRNSRVVAEFSVTAQDSARGPWCYS